jgi:hypothetical protein
MCGSSPLWAEPGFSGAGVGIDAGTLGAGVTLVKSIVPHTLTAEVDLNAPIKFNYDATISGTRYDGKLRMEGLGALLNYFPSPRHLFHLSAGVYYDRNQVDVDAQIPHAGFTLNGRLYTSSELISLSDRASFSHSAPYVGLGWGDGSASPGLHFIANAGVLYQGSAQVQLIGRTPYLTGSAQYNALFASLDGQRQIIANDLNDHLRWYPVLSLALLYCF